MLEFTGERVIPGLVDPNLLNEHIGRYRFAALFAGQAVVLDAGCGSGYGTAELENAARVIAIDVSAEAVTHARQTFSRPGVDFLQGACEVLPFADLSFDLVVAFEVIEHLERWPDFLAEARRVLRPSGVLLVSTPNKAWYAESRAAAGPNPYHVREFEYREFVSALQTVFPHVCLWTQNHSEAIAFVRDATVCDTTSAGILDAPADTHVEQAHFFYAACSQSPIAQTRTFAWMPVTGNILRERERHIALLESELRTRDLWLQQARQNVLALQAEVLERNSWAARLNEDLAQAATAVTELQLEAAVRLEWIADLESQIARGRSQIESMERTILERTVWAQTLDADLKRLAGEAQALRDELDSRERQLRAIARSKWIRFGNKLHLGPVVG